MEGNLKVYHPYTRWSRRRKPHHLLMSSAVERSLILELHARAQKKIRNLIRSLPALGVWPSRSCRGFPSHCILDFARNDKSCAVRLRPKMIDILFNSFTCDAVPGLSPALRDRT